MTFLPDFTTLTFSFSAKDDTSSKMSRMGGMPTPFKSTGDLATAAVTAVDANKELKYQDEPAGQSLKFFVAILSLPTECLLLQSC